MLSKAFLLLILLIPLLLLTNHPKVAQEVTSLIFFVWLINIFYGLWHEKD